MVFPASRIRRKARKESGVDPRESTTVRTTMQRTVKSKKYTVTNNKNKSEIDISSLFPKRVSVVVGGVKKKKKKAVGLSCEHHDGCSTAKNSVKLSINRSIINQPLSPTSTQALRKSLSTSMSTNNIGHDISHIQSHIHTVLPFYLFSSMSNNN